MRKLVAGMFLTLDGVVQAPGGPDEDREGGFAHGGWTVPFFDEKLGALLTEGTLRAEAFLLGRKTYDIFAGSWPKVTDPDDALAAALNGRPKFVASRTLKDAAWAHSTVLQGDLTEAVAKLKAGEGGEIQVLGSANLLQTLLKSDLVDTLSLVTFPVVAGSGKRLFHDGVLPGAFRLAENHVTTTGVMLNVYERTGALRHGVFEGNAVPLLVD